jgi:general secretion pathway protein B
MSFILDALRKSEHERQRGIGPSFADIKSAGPARRLPILWIAIGLLLTVNVVALGVLLVQRGQTAQAPIDQAAIAMLSVTAKPAAAVALPPAPSTIASPLPAAAAPSAAGVEDASGVEPAPEPEPLLDRPRLANYAVDQNLPTMNDVIAEGRAQLPELHLDMHVFAAAPEQRFVSINAHKLREGMQIEEGLRIERITPEGVVLNQRGLRFLLPRQ